MYIRNLLKNDYRTKKGKALRQHQQEVERHKLLQILVSVAILTFFAFTILTKTIYDLTHPSRKPSGMIEKVEVVKAAEPLKPLTWSDAIRQVFTEDEAGLMIRICMTENKAQNKYAMNINTNKTYDYSWCQVNSCHKPKSMTHSDWMKSLEDPMFNAQQVRKIYLSQGWYAWVVFNKGLVK